jgi:hypothetical protein
MIMNTLEVNMAYENVKAWRRRTRENLIVASGGCCAECGYNRCAQALEFHHINGTEKEFSIAQRIRSLESIVAEVKKCVLLCCRCHREVHYGELKFSSTHLGFDETVFFNLYRRTDNTPCEFCGEPKSIRRRFCSPRCCGMGSRRHAWTAQLLTDALKQHKYNISAVGREFGVTGNAIRKQMRRFNISV